MRMRLRLNNPSTRSPVQEGWTLVLIPIRAVQHFALLSLLPHGERMPFVLNALCRNPTHLER